MKKIKVCYFNRSSIHYRKNIYMLMDKELPCDFYFGDSRPGGIAPVSYDLLSNYKGEFHNVSLGPFYWQRGALRLLKSDYTDIITPADPYCLSTWMLILLARCHGKNIFTWTHGAYGDEGWFKRRIVRWKCRRLKGLFLYGEYARHLLESWGVPPNKLHLIYNSLDYDEQIPIREGLALSPLYQNHFGNNNPNIVFIGRLTSVKKLDQIIEASCGLKDRGNPVNVTFIGDGKERESLHLRAEKFGIIDSIWFYGPCYDERIIADFLFNADLCVSPGNVGLTAMHAMTFGCPVISHDNYQHQMPEFEAIIDGITGAFFKENDIRSLADAINSWLVTHSDDRENVRKACFEVIDEKYNPHVQLETIRKALNE